MFCLTANHCNHSIGPLQQLQSDVVKLNVYIIYIYKHNTPEKKTETGAQGVFASLCTAVLFVISPKHYQYFTTYNA